MDFRRTGEGHRTDKPVEGEMSALSISRPRRPDVGIRLVLYEFNSPSSDLRQQKKMLKPSPVDDGCLGNARRRLMQPWWTPGEREWKPDPHPRLCIQLADSFLTSFNPKNEQFVVKAKHLSLVSLRESVEVLQM
ncbi:hypothetical protein F2P81_009246 [Scophthalmus maximus]|uniref:Uncharacterized protein n=1 Tax=Scophthalmus maximus TaxID=52904 RepID=A0A6A4T9C3_SCOMX|nr:hypothetical protein F2P81_009246 [Scophthalmus maximus]